MIRDLKKGDRLLLGDDLVGSTAEIVLVGRVNRHIVSGHSIKGRCEVSVVFDSEDLEKGSIVYDEKTGVVPFSHAMMLDDAGFVGHVARVRAAFRQTILDVEKARDLFEADLTLFNVSCDPAPNTS